MRTTIEVAIKEMEAAKQCLQKVSNLLQEREMSVCSDIRYDKPGEDWVLINGVKWATRNVDKPGTFAATPESAGKFYQWNRKKARAATGSVSGWHRTFCEDPEWTATNDPSPEGWRVPTWGEIQSLLDKDKVSNVWTTQNGVSGRKFTDLTTGASLFLPAVGYRVHNDGTLNYAGTGGYYWGGAMEDSLYAHSLGFDSSSAYLNLSYHLIGQSVRAVVE